MGPVGESRLPESAAPTEPDVGWDADAEHRAYVEAWERAHPGQPFPRPWQTLEDARGWRTIARGKHWPARPDADVELRVVLSPDDYVWVARRARAAGLRPSQYLVRLVADARAERRVHEAEDERVPAIQPSSKGSRSRPGRDSAAAR